jgi:Fe-S-cluster containining protein
MPKESPSATPHPSPTARPASNGRRRKPHREDLEPGEVLCQFCPAKCCRYFALPIDTPTEWSDFEYMRWYLLHYRAAVFTEDGSWYLLVYSPCQHHGEDNRCAIYDDRPPICRQYKTKDCEYEDECVYDQYFEVPEQVEEYAEAVLGKPRKGRGIRSLKPFSRGDCAACLKPV